MKVFLLLATALLLGLSLFNPPYPKEQSLQHTPTAMALLILAIETRKKWISTASFTCLILFFWLHILGARYIYSFVPYDRWYTTLTGNSLSDIFGWQRNHYDRLVHFCYGMLFIYPAYEIAKTYGQMTWRWALLFSLLWVTTLSAMYEIFEWLLTLLMASQQAEAYNGQQGDFWDAQKDMALAAGGSALAMVFCCLHHFRKNKNKSEKFIN